VDRDTEGGRARRLLAWASIIAAFAVLLRWSWLKWPDVLIDFGHELYIPWQLSLGKPLYRDIMSKNGPLSPYWNALLFLGFGVSLKTLVFANIAILAGMTVLIHGLLRRFSGLLAATVATLVFLAIFAFSQYVRMGSFNYICPYSHSQTHGLALSLLLLYFLGKYPEGRRLRQIAWAGLCLGLTFLTKMELFTAAAAAAALGFILFFSTEPFAGRRVLTASACFGAAALLPAALFFLFLLKQMPASEALAGTVGNWTYLKTQAGNPMFQAGMGVDRPWDNIALMLGLLLGCLVAAGAAAAADRATLHLKARRVLIPVSGVLVFLLAATESSLGLWSRLPRVLPVVASGACAAATMLCLSRRGDPSRAVKSILLALWSAFSLVLLGKMLLNSRIINYGFVLAMPAALLLVVLLVSVLPEWMRRVNGGGGLFRALMLGLIFAGVFQHLLWSNRFYSSKSFGIWQGGDAVLTYSPDSEPTGYAMVLAAQELGKISGPGSTLLVLPEGAMLNYVLRRENPTPYPLLMPADIASAGGEAVVLERIRERAPDFIVLMHRHTREYGFDYFGAEAGYGKQVMQWVGKNYVRARLIGAVPLRDERFGIEILGRKMEAPVP